MAIAIPGLPEGVECVRIGIAGPDDYEIQSDGIYKGKREGSVSQIIVVPSRGWEFRYNIREMMFLPVKVFDTPQKASVTVNFEFKYEQDRGVIEWLRGQIKDKPGFVSLVENQ